MQVFTANFAAAPVFPAISGAVRNAVTRASGVPGFFYPNFAAFLMAVFSFRAVAVSTTKPAMTAET